MKPDLVPDEANRLVMETGPHPETDAEDADWENEGGATERDDRVPDAQTQIGTRPNEDQELGGEG